MLYYVETCTDAGRFVQGACTSRTDAFDLAATLCKQLLMDVVVTNDLDCIIKRFSVND